MNEQALESVRSPNELTGQIVSLRDLLARRRDIQRAAIDEK